MLGLLGGLLGGGIARGLASRGGGGGTQQRNLEPMPDKDAPMARQPEEPAGQAAPEKPQQQPQQQQAPQPVTNTVATEIAESQPQPQQQQQPLAGLLDDAPPVQQPSQGPTNEMPPPPQTVVNQTDSPTPVARPADEQFGEIPAAPKLDMLRNQLLDSGSNKQPFPYQDGNPSRKPNLPNQSFSADQGFRYSGPSGVEGALPPRRYR